MKKRFEDGDFERVESEGGKVRYRHVGPLFALDLSRADRAWFYAATWGAAAAGWALFLAAGLLNNPGMRQFYVALPYVALFMPLALMVGGAAQLSASRGRFTRGQWARIVLRQRRLALAGAILSAAAAAGDALFCALGGAGAARLGEEGAFMALLTALSTVLGVFFYIHKRIKAHIIR